MISDSFVSQSKVLILAAKIEGSNIYRPIWEFNHREDGYYGNCYFLDKSLPYDFIHASSFIQVYYDLNTKEIISGIEIKLYPQEKELLQINQEILREVPGEPNKLVKDKVVDVFYQSRSSNISFGKDLKNDSHSYYKLLVLTYGKELDMNTLYHIKSMEPRYKLENGTKEKYWPHEVKILID